MAKYLNFKDEKIKGLFLLKENINPKDLIYLFLDDDTKKQRFLLRSILFKENSLNIVLVSTNNLSELAWKANLLHFIQINDKVDEQIQNLFTKIVYFEDKRRIIGKIRLGDSKGADIIEVDKIFYCKADGNYSTLVFNNFKKKTYTIQLNQLDELLTRFPNIVRIGKSFIINLHFIRRIEKDKVILSYENKEFTLKLSKLMIQRIKKEIAWY